MTRNTYLSELQSVRKNVEPKLKVRSLFLFLINASFLIGGGGGGNLEFFCEKNWALPLPGMD